MEMLKQGKREMESHGLVCECDILRRPRVKWMTMIIVMIEMVNDIQISFFFVSSTSLSNSTLRKRPLCFCFIHPHASKEDLYTSFTSTSAFSMPSFAPSVPGNR